jgi:hypothetical protein
MRNEQEICLQLTDENAVDTYTKLVARWHKEQLTIEKESQDLVQANPLDYRPDRTEVMNREMVGALENCLTYFRDVSGVPTPMVRVGTEGNQWSIVDAPALGLHLLPPFRVQLLKTAYISTMQKPMQGATYEVFGKNGVAIAGFKNWGELIDISMDRIEDACKDDDFLTPPSAREVARLKKVRTLDDKVDPTMIQPLDVYMSHSPEGKGHKLWKSEPKLEVPQPVTISNDVREPTFCYVDLTKFKAGDTPNFDGFMSSMPESVRGVFMATIYATIFAECHHPLVVWMHGEGGNGKSQFFDAINKYFGDKLVGSVSTSQVTTQFGLEPLIGKRIIIFGDCQSGNILSSNAVHGITGGDAISVDRKNLKGITYRFKAQLFIGSNTAPNIKLNAMNETRRILYVPMGEPDKETMKKYCEVDENGEIVRREGGHPVLKSYDLKGELVKEMPHILHKCKEQFEIYCKPPYNQIAVPKEAFDLMAQNCENGQNLIMGDFLSQNYTITGSDNDTVRVSELHGSYLDEVFGNNAGMQVNKYSFEVSEFSRFVQTAGVKKATKRENGIRLSVYTGIKEKSVGGIV